MSKYKIYYKINTPISYSEFPSRLLKFKRSKWKRIKSGFFKLLKHFKKLRRFQRYRHRYKNRFKNKKIYKKCRNKNHINFKSRRSVKILLNLRVRSKFYQKVKNAYKNGLILKHKFNQFFGFTLSLKYLKKQALLKRNISCQFFIKPFFKLDILLWKLKFFHSIKQVQQHIKSKNVLVNNTVINTTNFFLKKGDIIKIKNKNINAFNKTRIKTSFILSFLEVDFYSYRIIILKSFENLTLNDFKLIFYALENLRSYIYYLKRK